MIVKKSDIAWNQLPAIMLTEYIQPESSYISILSLYFGSCEVWSLFNAIDIDFFSLPAIWDPRLNKIYGWTKIHFEKMYILFEFSWPLTTYPKHLCNQKLGHWNSWSRCFFHSLSCCILNLSRHTERKWVHLFPTHVRNSLEPAKNSLLHINNSEFSIVFARWTGFHSLIVVVAIAVGSCSIHICWI